MSWRQYAVRHLVHLPLHSRVLDVAVGTGDLSLCLLRQRPDYQVVGIDPSVEMLQRAKRKLSGCSSSAVVLEKGEAEQLPFADGSFDAVMVNTTRSSFTLYLPFSSYHLGCVWSSQFSR
jgi:demethylmenaquinone methyltransferase/2-methoxy-6-polyprenyl-1,4-benzoquinol methylase